MDEEQHRGSLGFYILCGIGIAVILSVIAVAVLLFSAGAAHYGGDVGEEPSALLVSIPYVVGSYFLGALVGAVGVWALEPARKNRWGWAASGMVVACAGYGAVGIGAALLLQYAGVDMIGFESVEEAWSSIPIMTAILTLAGIPGGLYAKWYFE